jgi:hypothetical protein
METILEQGSVKNETDNTGKNKKLGHYCPCGPWQNYFGQCHAQTERYLPREAGDWLSMWLTNLVKPQVLIPEIIGLLILAVFVLELRRGANR